MIPAAGIGPRPDFSFLPTGEWRLAGSSLQQLTLQFPTVLSGPVTVSIEFGYPLRDALSGFYRSTFTGGQFNCRTKPRLKWANG